MQKTVRIVANTYEQNLNIQRDKNNKIIVPIGTIVVSEIRGPKGYRINKKRFIIRCDETLYYKPVTVKEEPIKVKLQKLHGGRPLDGAVFIHTRPDKTTREVETGSDGSLVLIGLARGKHTLKEIKAPDGYKKLDKVIEFEINDNQEIVTVDKEFAKWSEEENGDKIVKVQNKPASYKLKVHKKSDSGKALKGARFKLEDDNGNSIEKETNKDGIILFEGLESEKEYFITETRAPRGYKMLKDKDGKPYRYKIKAKSIPVEDIFEAVLEDDRANIEKDGRNIKIGGEKGEREVLIKLINKENDVLPVTGTRYGIGILLLGIILISLKVKRS